MKRKMVIYGAICIASIVFFIISMIVLPEEIITQIGSNGSNKTMPKLLALLIPTALSIIGIIYSWVSGDKQKNMDKGIIISCTGLAIFLLTLVMNLVR